MGKTLDFKKSYTNHNCKEVQKESNFFFSVENEVLEYNLTIYPNGTVRIFIQPLKRDSVSFAGKLDHKNKDK